MESAARRSCRLACEQTMLRANVTRTRTRRRQVVVLSSHLDDAALSLGGFIARSAREGSAVTVVTVFAGDPGSTLPASAWDRRCGFQTAADAARGRRLEDRRACALLGSAAVWLPLHDHEYGAERDPDGVWRLLAPHLEGPDLVLVPGAPLVHPDHAW
jgi:LmbE family N-acetylglucosaminyl deacetylase